jgi:ABC-type transport system involved in multi-copper enzyme maturation permease subunit
MSDKTHNVYRSRKKILFDNFLGGIVWSLGVWLGTTIIIGIVALFASNIDFVPIIGDFVAEVSKHAVERSSPFNF